MSVSDFRIGLEIKVILPLLTLWQKSALIPFRDVVIVAIFVCHLNHHKAGIVRHRADSEVYWRLILMPRNLSLIRSIFTFVMVAN